MIGPQATKPQLERGESKFYRKRSVKKRKTGINRSRVFEIASREAGNGKVEGMEILLGRASIIQCFCNAKGNIQ